VREGKFILQTWDSDAREKDSDVHERESDWEHTARASHYERGTRRGRETSGGTMSHRLRNFIGLDSREAKVLRENTARNRSRRSVEQHLRMLQLEQEVGALWSGSASANASVIFDASHSSGKYSLMRGSSNGSNEGDGSGTEGMNRTISDGMSGGSSDEPSSVDAQLLRFSSLPPHLASERPGGVRFEGKVLVRKIELYQEQELIEHFECELDLSERAPRTEVYEDLHLFSGGPGDLEY